MGGRCFARRPNTSPESPALRPGEPSKSLRSLLLLSTTPIFYYLAGTGIRARSTHLAHHFRVTMHTASLRAGGAEHIDEGAARRAARGAGEEHPKRVSQSWTEGRSHVGAPIGGSTFGLGTEGHSHA